MGIPRPGFLLKKGVVKAIRFGLISFCYVWKFYKIAQFSDDTQMMSQVESNFLLSKSEYGRKSGLVMNMQLGLEMKCSP